MSLNNVVNKLVRAAASVPLDISDTDLDAHVARLLADEAKANDAKWSELGLGAYLDRGGSDSPDPSLPKPNKRFLSSVIRAVDGHNNALLRQQAQAARDARRGMDKTARRDDGKTGASRLFGGAMRGVGREATKRDSREHERRGDRGDGEKRRDERDRDRRDDRDGPSRRTRDRSGERRRHSDRPRDHFDDERPKRRDSGEDHRRSRRHDSDEEHKRRREDKPRSSRRDDSTDRERRKRKDNRSRSRSPSRTGKSDRRRKSTSPDVHSAKKHHAPPPPPLDSPPPPPSRSPTPPPKLSRMDKYFKNDYDPRFDVGDVPKTGPVVAVGWDNMLAVLKEKGRKRRRHSPGLSSSPEPERKPRDSERKKEKASAASASSAMTNEMQALMDMEYTPKGGLRAWDVGK